MGTMAKHWLLASILAAALWAAVSGATEQKAQPKAFNSTVAFDVYPVMGDDRQLVGRTPSEQPLAIPPCKWWWVEPRRYPVGIEMVRHQSVAVAQANLFRPGPEPGRTRLAARCGGY
jgi:hypothetical protein